MELGIYTFGDIVPDAQTGRKVSPAERMDEVIAAARIADEVGLDVFGQIDVGGPPFSVVAKAIELFGIEVAPVIRRKTAQSSTASV